MRVHKTWNVWISAPSAEDSVTVARLYTRQTKYNYTSTILCNAPYCSSSLVLRKALHWLPVEQRLQHKITVMTYKVRLHQQPCTVSTYILYIHQRTPPSSITTVCQQCATDNSYNQNINCCSCFSRCSPKIWNSLPITVETVYLSLHQFSCLLKGLV